LEITVKGAGFAHGSTVLWNSSPVATAYLSSSSLVALIPAADLTTPGTATVSVAGGTSSSVMFTISSN
jgi:trimeric autotransporter adhesin